MIVEQSSLKENTQWLNAGLPLVFEELSKPTWS
jgi:hypothetical protein